jgi:phosphatidylserine/phosphatidylglycerophosphate/cardiolipin synthase-like enzyme
VNGLRPCDTAKHRDRPLGGVVQGIPIVSHTKFINVDHEIVLLTSANFSFNAENRSVEFGLLIRDSGLAVSIESTMTGKRGSLYELV